MYKEEHSIFRDQSYLQFQASNGGLGMYSSSVGEMTIHTMILYGEEGLSLVQY